MKMNFNTTFVIVRNLWTRDLFPEQDNLIIEPASFYTIYKPQDNPAGSNMLQFFLKNKAIIFVLNGFVGLCYQ